MSLINDNEPPFPKTEPIRVPDLNPEVLRRMDHEQWLRDFSITMQAGREKRGGLMTPFLQGVITKLQWAAQYIHVLKGDLHWLARDNKLLRKHIEHLGAVPAPAFRPDAERAYETPVTAEQIFNLDSKEKMFGGQKPPTDEDLIAGGKITPAELEDEPK